MHQQSPVVQQMGDWCGFTKHKSTQHTTKKRTNKNTDIRGDGAQGGVRRTLLFSALPRWGLTHKDSGKELSHRRETSGRRAETACKPPRRPHGATQGHTGTGAVRATPHVDKSHAQADNQSLALWQSSGQWRVKQRRVLACVRASVRETQKS